MCSTTFVAKILPFLAVILRFTFPSTKYPELTAKAKFSYKLAELQELHDFASTRGVKGDPRCPMSPADVLVYRDG